jgi:site-specific DNA-methyltransferase (adenine-specific)
MLKLNSDEQIRPRTAATSGPSALSMSAFTNGNVNVGVITADVLSGLRELPEAAFDVVVTSPPYYWVRDYGIEGQIGHEQSVDEYVEQMASVFSEVKRVLHPKGVLYLNLGDTYYSGNGQPHGTDPKSPSRNFMRKKLRPVDQSGWKIPKKSLIGVPWKVAFRLQEQGWTLRSDIIWCRKNAFSEPSARDRPKRQYEHIFLFSQSRSYAFDARHLKENDVWNIDIQRSRSIEHNAAFPTELVSRCIQTGSPEGGRVLDPFVGSGTTIFSAISLGRSCVGIDLKEEYTSGIRRILKTKHLNPTAWSDLQSALVSDDDARRTWHNPVELP